MEKLIENYLEQIYNYLKPLPLSEKTDIINEIKSHIIDKMNSTGQSAEQILSQLESPQNLASAYVGKSIAESNNYRFSHTLKVASFYCTTGFSGMFVVPFMAVLSVGLYLSSIISVISGSISTIAYLLGYEMPWVIFNFGFWSAPEILHFPLSVVLATLLFFLGRECWKVLRKYLSIISSKHKSIFTKDNIG